MNRLGRPYKGQTKRMQITAYIDAGLLEKMDEVVEKERARGNSGFSRSEIINIAVREWLKNNLTSI